MTEKSESELPKPTDSCPTWAQELILQLREVEIILGNIPKAIAWQSEYVKDVSHKVFNSEEQVFDDEKTELIYRRIVKGLAQENFDAKQICEFINVRIGYKGGPVYTSVEEVQEAIDS